MSSNLIPVFTGEWLIDALRCRIDEIKSEAEALETVTRQHNLSNEVVSACTEMVSSIHRMESRLTQLEDCVSAYHFHAPAHRSEVAGEKQH
jgi:hypothetical protein